MTSSWKIFAFAGSAVLAGALAACTVTTTNSGDDDGGLVFDDDSGAGNDTGTTTDTGTTPTCDIETFSDGGSTALSLDPPGSGSTTCTTCTETSCCDKLTACFQDPTGDCQDLETCLEQVVENPDAGVTAEDCASLHSSASTDLHNAWADCQTSNCSSQCQ